MAQLPGWIPRKKIIIKDIHVDSDLVDFPLYVKIANDPDFHRARGDGHNIRFTLSDGITLLKYEREYWSGGNGKPVTAHFWVKVPSILASGGAIIYIYYGKPDAPDGEDAPNVWNANFKGVWHMKENGGLVKDSTIEGNDGILHPTPVLISACDELTDWEATAGGVLSIDNADYQEGTGSLKNTISAPAANASYNAWFNPTGSWDWSAKKHILCRFKCERANTAFTWARLQLYDTLGNWRYWNLTFSAGVWKAVKELLATGDAESETPPDLALINNVYLYMRAPDTVPYYYKIDYLRIDDRPQWVDGVVGKALKFDPVDDYVDCGKDAGSLDGASFSVSGWFKTSNIIRWTTLSKGVSGKDRYLVFGIRGNKRPMFAFYSDDLAGDPPCEPNTLYQIVGTYDAVGRVRKIYVNAELSGQDVADGDLIGTNNYPLRFNRYYQYFDDIMDEIRISNAAWSFAWVKFEHHNIIEAENEITWGKEEGVYYGPGFPIFEKKKELLLIDEKKPVLIGHRR